MAGIKKKTVNKRRASRRKPKLTDDQKRLTKASKYSGPLVDVRLMGNYKRDGKTLLAGQMIKMHSDELADHQHLCEAGAIREEEFREFTETLGLKGRDRRITAPGK